METSPEEQGSAYVASLADVLGIDHMAEAYRNGVPIDYITASDEKTGKSL